MTEPATNPHHDSDYTSGYNAFEVTGPLLSDQDIEQHLHAIQELLDDKKALDLVTIDLRDRSAMADYFIVCSGNSKTHTRALAEAAHQYVKDAGLHIYSLEGKHEGSWVLLDVGFLVVHVMQESLREFYNLEQLWSHAQQQSAP